MAYNKFLEKLSTWIILNTFFLTWKVPNWSSKTWSLKIFSWFWFDSMDYRKIPNILSPGAYISQRPFWGAYYWSGLYLRGLCGGKYSLLNRLGLYLKGNVGPKIDWTGKLCQLGFTDTRCEDVSLSKTQASKLKTQPQITLLKTQYSVQR